MDGAIQAFTKNVILNPAYQEPLALIKSARNGFVYGWKIRFPHALVMTFLFRDGPIEDKLRFIFKAAMTHGTNLFKFATIYKTLMLFLRKAQGREHRLDAYIAGGVGGYIVFKENNAINQQMILYLFSRIVIGTAYLLQKEGYIPIPEEKNGQVFGYFAAFCWAMVMGLFRHERDVLQPSLAASMVYIYEDSERWNSLRNWIWHNR